MATPNLPRYISIEDEFVTWPDIKYMFNNDIPHKTLMNIHFELGRMMVFTWHMFRLQMVNAVTSSITATGNNLHFNINGTAAVSFQVYTRPAGTTDEFKPADVQVRNTLVTVNGKSSFAFWGKLMGRVKLYLAFNSLCRGGDDVCVYQEDNPVFYMSSTRNPLSWVVGQLNSLLTNDNHSLISYNYFPTESVRDVDVQLYDARAMENGRLFQHFDKENDDRLQRVFTFLIGYDKTSVDLRQVCLYDKPPVYNPCKKIVKS